MAIITDHHAKIWIDGSDDAAFLGSARAAMQQLLCDEHIQFMPHFKTRKLAGLAAIKTSYVKGGKLAI